VKLFLSELHKLFSSFPSPFAPFSICYELLADMTQQRLFLEAVDKLRQQLLRDFQDSLKKHEADGTLDNAGYQQERMAFFSRHLCQVKPMPDILISSLQALHTDRTVNHIMDAWLLSHLTIVV
jgi:hypothetical protein